MSVPAPSPWLTDAELADATRRKRPSAQARALRAMGVPFRPRLDGSLLVSRDALARVLSAEPLRVDNGLNWSRTA